jgi:hypothetical protein
MKSVKGLFDGKKIKLLEDIEIEEPQEVIITFLGPTEDEKFYKKLYKLAEKGGSFDFLNDPEEDIYSEKDLKVDYRK